MFRCGYLHLLAPFDILAGKAEDFRVHVLAFRQDAVIYECVE